MRRAGWSERGGILLMVLVLTSMVIVFLVSGVLLSGRQFNATVEQEEEERAFHSAEAGVHYALYLLNSQGSGQDEFSLVEQGSWPQQTVFQKDTGKVIGTYDLQFTLLPDGVPGKGLTVYSLGKDKRGEQCQLIRADLRRVSTLQVAYGVTAWDHDVDCEGAP